MRILKLSSLATIAGTIALLFFSNTYSAKANTITAEEFVKKASIGNQFEIESSKLAMERAKAENIKQFADRMVTDHTNMGTDLESAVASANMDTSLIAKTLDKKHQDKLAKLDKATEKDFDKKYVDEQVDAHKDTVKLFGDYAKNGSNATLKSFANKTLPALEDHKKQIKDIKSSM